MIALVIVVGVVNWISKALSEIGKAIKGLAGASAVALVVVLIAAYFSGIKNPSPIQAQAPAQAPASQCSVPNLSAEHQQWLIAADVNKCEWADLDFVLTRESGWQVTVWNHQGSGAYGLCQAKPASKMDSAGADWQTNPVTQLKWCNQNAHSGRYTGWASVKAWWLRTDCRPPGANPCYSGHWW